MEEPLRPFCRGLSHPSLVSRLQESTNQWPRGFERARHGAVPCRCQQAFTTGLAANFVGMTMTAHHYCGWWSVLGAGALGFGAMKVFKPTSDRLFSNASIVNYWREDLGGRPAPDDPYDLSVPLAYLTARVRGMRACGILCTGGLVGR